MFYQYVEFKIFYYEKLEGIKLDMEIRGIVDDAIEKKIQIQIDLFDYSEQTIVELGEVVEILFANKMFMLGNKFLPTLDLVINRLMKKEYKKDNKSNNINMYYTLLETASEYHCLRDYIYYSYADENSILWEKKKDRIHIRVCDKSIFRQLVHNMQSLFIESSKLTKHNILHLDDVLLCLKGKDEFDFNNDEIQKVLYSVEMEVCLKISSYFSYIPEDSKISLGNYTYSDFFCIYKELLKSALYRRYYSYANDLPSVIISDSSELCDCISNSLQIDKQKCFNILQDISESSRGTFIYIKQVDKFIMYTTCFSLLDGLNNILKNYAHNNSKGFLTNFAEPIGEALVDDVEKSFLQYENFRCIKDRKLNKYSKHLPDIDLLAISYEPSMGFHIFACEVKNVLMPIWAKDYLKSIGKNGYILKALSQMGKIEEFLSTEKGHEMLYNIVLEKFSNVDIKKVLPHGFCIVVDFIIVTSENIGVLCDDNNKNIISVLMLREIIKNSDGDVNYIKYCLNDLKRSMDSCTKVVRAKSVINDLKVEYEACSSDTVLKFRKNVYISDGTYRDLEKTSSDTGYSFIDTLLDCEDISTK